MCDALQNRSVQGAAGTPAAWELVSSGQGWEWTGQGPGQREALAAGICSTRLPRPGQRSTCSQEAQPELPSPRPPHHLCCAPWGRGPAILLTSWDGAPSPGSNLSGALNHSGRRRLGSHSHTGRQGPGGHGRGSGSHGELAAGPPGSPPTPTPPLSLGKEGRRRGPRGAVTSEAVCTMAPLRAGREMDSWFPSQLSKCHPAPKHTPPRAPPRRWGDGGHGGATVSPRGLHWAEEQGPRGTSVSLFGGWAPCPGVQDGVLQPRRQEGAEACRGADGGGGGVGRPRPELVDVLSPPPNILGFWAEVSWLIWVPISGRLSCH